MAIYTVEDPETKRRITFEWSGDKDPTDDDLESIFASQAAPTELPQAEKKGVVPTLKAAATNFPSSAYGYGKDLLSLATRPKESAEAAGQLLSGGLQAAVGSQKDTEARQLFSKFVDNMGGRYGSLENARQTFEQDPVGMAADASSILMGTGLATRLAALPAKSAPLTSLGRGLQTVGATLEPTTAAMQGIGAAGKLIPQGVPKKMYESAAKFSTVLTENERATLTKTALANDITPTIKGVVKTNDLIDTLNKKISTMIDEATSGGAARTMPIDELFKDLDALGKTVLETSGDPIKGIRAIDAIEAQIRKANKLLQRTDLSPADAQKLKQNIYKELDGAYAEFTNSPVNKKAKKLIAKSAKEYLEEIIPEIKQLNAEEGALIELREVIQRSANRVTNRDLIGIGAPIKAAAGGASGLPGAVVGYTIGLLDTPAIKSKLAFAIEKLRTKGIKIRSASAAVRLGLINVGRSLEDQGEPIIPNRMSVGHVDDTDLQRLLGR